MAKLSVDVAIVGGGLAGLALADQLQRAGASFHLFEARQSLGGRVRAHSVGDGQFDVGPSWFWPGQPRLAAMVERFGLEVFEQHASGAQTYETETGEVQRGRGYASMQGSYRLVGGMPALTDSLAQGLPTDHLTLGASVAAIRRDGASLNLLQAEEDVLCSTNSVVLAVPPRVADTIIFSPALPDAAHEAMRAIPTWMAGQAKFLAVYDQPFWRPAGLSGDAMSRHGPMVEVHDASDPRSGHGALFGFIGVPAHIRADNRPALHDACLAQLGRLFGDAALSPIDCLVQDWALERETATQDDWQGPQSHPDYGLPHALGDLWDGHLVFGSTEIADQFGGYLEGALEAAELVAARLKSRHAG